MWMRTRQGPREEMRIDSLLLPLVLRIKCFSVGKKSDISTGLISHFSPDNVVIAFTHAMS